MINTEFEQKKYCFRKLIEESNQYKNIVQFYIKKLWKLFNINLCFENANTNF